MKNKAIRTIQRKGVQMVEIIIAIISIIVISIGVKAMVRASEVQAVDREEYTNCWQHSKCNTK